MQNKPYFSLYQDSNGFTLIETVVGLAVFLLIAIPAMQYAARLSTNTRAADAQAAVSILEGESHIIYRTRCLPQTNRDIEINKKTYSVSCAHEPDTGLVLWSMDVTRDGKSIVRINGLLFISIPDTQLKQY